MSKKTWILITCLVLSLAMGLGGSLAYLTDRDADVNVFTMGNVDIELTEDFEQGSELMPGLDITKDVKVKNIGKNEAYVWVQIALPAALDNSDPSLNVLHFNYSPESVGEGQWKWLDAADNWANVPTTTIDNVEYKVYTVLYQSPLAPGAETPYSAMTKVYMDKSIDVAPDGKLYRVVKGEVTEITWNVEDVPYMYVSAYAIQTEGFTSVDEAYNAYNAQWTTDAGDNNGLIWADPSEVQLPVQVSSVDDINAAIEAANKAGVGTRIALSGDVKDVQQNFYLDYVNGNGHAVNVGEYNYNANCTFTMQAGTIKNIQIFGAPRAIGTGSTGMELQGDLIIDSVYVDEGTYAINVGNGDGHTVKVNDSELYGWISVDGADLEITNSRIGKRNAAYNDLAVYDNVTLDNVKLVELDMFGRSATTDDAVITINNCDYVTLKEDGSDDSEVAITADNIFTLGLFDWTDSDTDYLKKCKLFVNDEEVTWPEN